MRVLALGCAESAGRRRTGVTAAMRCATVAVPGACPFSATSRLVSHPDASLAAPAAAVVGSPILASM